MKVKKGRKVSVGRREVGGTLKGKEGSRRKVREGKGRGVIEEDCKVRKGKDSAG